MPIRAARKCKCGLIIILKQDYHLCKYFKMDLSTLRITIDNIEDILNNALSKAERKLLIQNIARSINLYTTNDKLNIFNQEEL